MAETSTEPIRNQAEGAGAPQVSVTIASGARFRGVRAMARAIGCSSAYLSQVLHGRPASPRVRDALAERGITVAATADNERGVAPNGAEGG